MIIFSGLFWVFADYIGNQIARIIVKVIIVAVFAFVEIAIFANVQCLGWKAERLISQG